MLPLVVRAGGGSARDSLSILDQLLAGAGPEGVTYAGRSRCSGVTDAALLDDMVDALAAGDAAAVYGTVDRVVEAGHDPRRFAVDLLDRFRDLILLDAVPDAGERGLIDAPQDQLAHMADQAARLGGATLTRFAEIVHTALIEMRGTTSPRLVLELLCARMLLPDAATDAAAMLQRLERLERRQSLAQGSDATSGAGRHRLPPAAQPAAETAAAPPRKPAADGVVDAAGIRRLWPECSTSSSSRAGAPGRCSTTRRSTSSTASWSTSAPAAHSPKMIGEQSNTSLLAAALGSVFGGTWQSRRSQADDAGAGPRTERPARATRRAGRPQRRATRPTRSGDPRSGGAAAAESTWATRPVRRRRLDR